MEMSVASPEGSTARSLACNVFGVEHDSSELLSPKGT